MANLSIEERLLHYFLAMGAQQTENPQTDHAGISFLLGSDKVHVRLLKPEDFVQRNNIIDTMLAIASLRNSIQLVYLAVPRLFGASIDAATFRSHGIGLILFDDRRIDEPVVPRPVQPVTVQQRVQTHDQEIVKEIAALRSMYVEMDKMIGKLHKELIDLQQSPERALNASQESGPSRMLAADPIFAAHNTEIGQLPSFFTNNPWIEVLSKRGRAGDEPIAG